MFTHTQTAPKQYNTSYVPVSEFDHNEEINLIKRVQQSDDQVALNTLVENNYGLCHYVANKHAGYNVDVNDLVQEAAMALIESIYKFDPTRGVRLCSFATHNIKSKILEYAHKNYKVMKVATTKPQMKLFFNLKKLYAKYRYLSTQEKHETIAKDLEVSVEDVNEMAVRLLTSNTFYLTCENVDTEDDSPMLGIISRASRDSDKVCENVIDGLDNERMLNVLHEAIGTLSERDRDILTSRYLKDDKVSLAMLSEQYGVTAQRIEQISKNSLNKLRELMH